MNQSVTSREEILSVCRNIVARQGIQAITMREVARQCQTALGSVYNYFPSKDELLLRVIESIWKEIMEGVSFGKPSEHFPEQVERFFDCVRTGGEKYPSFFSVHSMSVAKGQREKGREAMSQYFGFLKSELLRSLKEDASVREDFFTDSCTREELVEFVFSSLLSLLMQGKDSCAVLTAVLRGALYES